MRVSNTTHSAPDAWACATPTTSANRHQAVTSSAAAQEMAIAPNGVRLMPRSVKMRASTGNAVIDMATPMNRANAVNGTCPSARIGYSHSANSDPSTNGAKMLACEIATKAWPRSRR